MWVDGEDDGDEDVGGGEPATTTTSDGPIVTNSGPNEFDFTLDDDDAPPVVEGKEGEEDPPSGEEPKDTAPKEPEVQPTTPAKEEPTAPQDATPTAEPVSTAQPQPTATANDPPTGLSPEQVKERREATLKDLEASYVVSDEDAEQFQLDPKVAVPKALAQVHLRAVESALQIMGQMLHSVIPIGIQQYEQVRVANEQVNNQVTARWPELKGHIETTSPSYKQVYAVFDGVRKQFPNATTEQVIEWGGKMAVDMLGLKAAPASPLPTPTQVVKPQPLPPVGGVLPSATPAHVNSDGGEFDFRDMEY